MGNACLLGILYTESRRRLHRGNHEVPSTVAIDTPTFRSSIFAMIVDFLFASKLDRKQKEATSKKPKGSIHHRYQHSSFPKQHLCNDHRVVLYVKTRPGLAISLHEIAMCLSLQEWGVFMPTHSHLLFFSVMHCSWTEFSFDLFLIRPVSSFSTFFFGEPNTSLKLII